LRIEFSIRHASTDWKSGQRQVRRTYKDAQFQKPKTRASYRRISLPNFHDLRDTFASLKISSGEDIVRMSRSWAMQEN
jgi:hypothetical protein